MLQKSVKMLSNGSCLRDSRVIGTLTPDGKKCLKVSQVYWLSKVHDLFNVERKRQNAKSCMDSGAPGYKMGTGSAQESTSQGLSSAECCEDTLRK